MNYEISISDAADAELIEYINFIVDNYKSPATAVKHYDDIMAAIRELRRNPFVNAIRLNSSLQEYGYGVRRFNYKKMAVIYTVSENTIYIHRIMPASMIIGL